MTASFSGRHRMNMMLTFRCNSPNASFKGLYHCIQELLRLIVTRTRVCHGEQLQGNIFKQISSRQKFVTLAPKKARHQISRAWTKGGEQKDSMKSDQARTSEFARAIRTQVERLGCVGRKINNEHRDPTRKTREQQLRQTPKTAATIPEHEKIN